ncbi:hypothetical protein CDD83_10161 [Cordyceps sp. RAO-2017]|nr:hypothetical protein CDD83_10161 [Cordyceps sp. RAO-2017]
MPPPPSQVMKPCLWEEASGCGSPAAVNNESTNCESSQTPATGVLSSIASNVFRHDCTDCPSRWSRFNAVDEENKTLMEQMAEVPIVHRHVYSNKSWVTESFTVNSPPMRQVLAKVLDKYQDLDLACVKWTFHPPYMPIVHRWDELRDFHKTATDEAQLKACRDLVDFLGPIVGPSVDALDQTRRTGNVAFESLWQIFPPGEQVMTKVFGQDAVCRVVKYNKRRKTAISPAAWIVDLEYVTWNGDECGYEKTRVTIVDYDGYQRALSLPAWPLSFSAQADSIKEKMIGRGRKFEELRTYHFMHYHGRKIVKVDGKQEERAASGRIVVDAFAYYMSTNEVKPRLLPLCSAKRETTKTGEERDASDSKSVSDTDSDLSSIVDGPELSVKPANTKAERQEDLEALADEHCLLATPWVFGFDLKDKQWGLFLVEGVEDIVWNDDAFSNLILPQDDKELAWSFVENKNFANSDFDDFVTDKGRGIIVLMFGPPGVGKTYTAEAVAEKGRVPLYTVSAGALGTRPDEIETALDRALELCRLWNAILLLDEADVFLSARHDDALVRNELVSIFLTKLEYYRGILFLSTNRISSIDHAFQSRVDLFLPYHDLGELARRQVWQNFIKHAGRGAVRFDVTDDDLDRLALLKLSGREIKNLVKSAQLLSLKSAQPVTMERLFSLANKRVQALEMLNAEGETN